jgi:phage tail-like protein
LDSAQDPIEYRNGNEDITVRKLPGLVKYSNITLKWGFTDDASLWEWRKKAMDGNVERQSGSIVLLDDAREEKVRWNFHNGWPTKWTGPGLNATGNEVAIETLEIAHESLTLEKA